MSTGAWRTLSEHLDHALELSDEERDEWLEQLRGQEPGLAGQLAELLATRSQAGFSEFLSGPPLIPEGAERIATLIGRRVGPYTIEAEIGRGGMGSVWRARRNDGRFEGVVAVKFVNAAWIGHAGEERFRTEGRLLARFDHPNIARLLDAGLLEDAQPYLVLEYVQGQPIDAYCARNALSIAERVRLFLSVLAAVSHAHSHLIVHRDLKPANIFITHDGTVKLLDFGIAKLIDAADSSMALTQSRLGPLTPQYAAPEQLLAQPVTTATDIYTLGLVLYICLTGTHPVPADVRSSADLVRTVLTQEPQRASSVAAGAGIEPSAIRGDLDNILAKALKKSPSERYVSAGAFADDLRRYLNHEPVSAHADTIPYRLGKFVRRHRSGVIAGTVFAAVLIGAVAFAVTQLFEARAQRDVARYEATHASAQVELTEFLLGDSLSQAPHEVLGERLKRARILIERRFRTEPALEAGLLNSLSGRFVDAGDYKDAADIANEIDAISHRLDDPDLNAGIACDKADDYAETGDLKHAHEQVELARADMRRLKAVAVGLAAECAMADAAIAEREGDYGRATQAVWGAMDALEKAGITRNSRYTSVAHEYARTLLLAGNYRAAWPAEQSVMAIAADVGRADSDAYYAMVNVGSTALIAGGQPRRALELLQTTIQKAQESNPNVSLPFYLGASVSLASIAAGAVDSGGGNLLQAAETGEKQGLASLIAVYRAGAIRGALNRGDLAAAKSYWDSTAPFLQKDLANPAWRRDAQRLLLVQARLKLAQQDLSEAAEQVQQAASLLPTEHQSDDPEWRQIVAMRAEIELQQHRYAAAVADARLALDRAKIEAVDPNSSAWVGEALLLRARGELALGDQAAAAASAREALPHVVQNLDPSNPLVAAAKSLSNGF